MSLLHYTYHPLIDVGIATLTAMSRKPKPENVTIEDLERCAEYLQRIYTYLPQVRRQLNSFFQNSHFTQPAMNADDRFAYADKVMFGFRPERTIIDGVNCAYFPEKPAYLYASRQHVPLLNGAGIKNFLPAGLPGLPLSGVALLAINALPLGCMKCERWMAFHQLRPANSNAPDMTLLLAMMSLRHNQKSISMMEVDETVGFTGFQHYRTRYVEAILAATLESSRRQSDLYHLTGYYFTNFGNNAGIDIVRLDNSIVDFVNTAQYDAAQVWGRIVARGWQLPKGETPEQEKKTDRGTWRNEVYEQLFRLPYNSRRFIGLLASAHNWNLISIFLRKVMGMEQERIDTYRMLGDRLVEYMDQFESDSLGFYHSFARARTYEEMRRVLRGAGERVAKAGGSKPLFTYNDFVFAFEHPSEGSRHWRLGRDLIAIRMLELLQQRNLDLSQLPSEDEEDEEAETVT